MPRFPKAYISNADFLMVLFLNDLRQDLLLASAGSSWSQAQTKSCSAVHVASLPFETTSTTLA